MRILPEPEAFARLYDAGQPCLLATRLVADLETPVSAWLKLCDGHPWSFLLESVEGGERLGRYSFLGFDPDLVWRCQDGVAAINRDPLGRPDAFEPVAEAPFDSLRSLIRESACSLPPGLPPMTAGLVGMLGYDMVRLIEDLPARLSRFVPIPDALLMRPRLICAFDAVEHVMTLMTPVRPVAGISAEAAYAAARERFARVTWDLSRSLPYPRPAPDGPQIPPASLADLERWSDTGREGYKAMVRKAVEYILAGDIFQVVPSHRMSRPFKASAFTFYRALRRLNPSPFLYYLELNGIQVAGSIPEILVRLRSGEVTIRPLAGTRRRGATPAEDLALEADLLADPKERAEHLMLVDLARNDVGRVAEIGSVSVPEMFQVERYSHVMHISSTVTGRLDRARADMVDALMAGFPAGTLSGAPKIRAMEIIEELEKTRRGLYGGCIGYFAADGTMDTCIALRTAVIENGTIHIQAGAGVVADSDPEAEWQETLHKAMALVRAAELAEAGG